MTNLCNRPIHQKPAPKTPDRERMAAVSDLPCVICHEYWMPQFSPTQVHHCIHGRGGQARAPDSMTIPLCEGHHMGDFDTSKIALHREPAKWREAYGPDTDWIAWATDRIASE